MAQALKLHIYHLPVMPEMKPPFQKSEGRTNYGTGYIRIAASVRQGGYHEKENIMFYRKKGSKYNATKINVDGIVFDSKREAKRYRELSHLLAIGEISDLQLQVPYELIPAVKEPDTFGVKGGRKPGKTIERAVTYKADFQYHDKDGKLIVEDVKGMRTKEYILKRKLMLWRWGIQIKEV